MRAARVLVLCLALWTAPVHAQVLVYDAAAFVNTTLLTIQAVLQTGYQALNLLGIPADAASAAQFAEDVAQIMALMQTAQMLSWDIQLLEMQLNRLFSLESAPSNTSELQIRLREIRAVMFQTYSYAMQVQSLINTMVRTVQHAIQLYEQIMSLVGNLAGIQRSQQWMAKLVQMEMKMQVQTTAFYRAQIVEKMSEPVIIESLTIINQEIMIGWPTGVR